MNESDIIKYIISIWNNDAYLSNYQLYAYEAPKTICHPIATYEKVNDQRYWDTCKGYNIWQFALKVYCTEEQFNTGLLIRDRIAKTYDNIKYNGTYKVMICNYISSETIKDTDVKGWQLGVILEIYTEDLP